VAKPAIKWTDKDLGWGELRNRVIKLSQRGAYCLVGVQGSEASRPHAKAELTVGQIATIHEFGTATIPQRSFIRAAIDEYQGAIQKRATLIGTGIMLLKFTIDQGLGLLGEYSVGIMKQRIADRIPPPLRPRTIARKGSSVPLIDSGQLRGSITHKIEAD
jgi:hypothetical protein